jgi:hypothetical protein
MNLRPSNKPIGYDRPLRRRRSSVLLGILAAILSLSLVAPSLGAQDSTKAKADSVAARLERAEEAIRLLQQQLAAESQSSVKTRSRLSLEFNGRVLVSAFSNSRRVNNVDVPLFVRPDTANGLPQGGGGMSIRQTQFGLAITADRVIGGTFHGDLDVDFFGGQQPSSGGRTFPLLRLRVARAQITWKYGEFLVGQESPLVSGVNPVSLASVGTPGFVGAGNLWLWLPQVRAGLETGGPVSLGIQGAVLAPMSGDPQSLFDTDNDIAERSKRPFLEGRVHLKWGSDELAGDIGAGIHRGWFATKGDSLLVSDAYTIDARVPLARWLELRGEGYDGKGMRSLGGGAIGQGFGINGVVIRSRGAWGQINLKPSLRVVFGGGYGVDDPRDEDLLPGSRLKNTAIEGHLHIRPAGPLVIGLEYRRLETSYAIGKLVNDHLNIAFGFEF